MCLRSIAGVLLKLVGSLRTTLSSNYCAPIVCVPDVIGFLAVCLHNKPKIKKSQPTYKFNEMKKRRKKKKKQKRKRKESYSLNIYVLRRDSGHAEDGTHFVTEWWAAQVSATGTWCMCGTASTSHVALSKPVPLLALVCSWGLFSIICDGVVTGWREPGWMSAVTQVVVCIWMAGCGHVTYCLLCMLGRVATLCGHVLSSLSCMFLVASQSC